ncbi:Brp/Blh family beta-carotene 15,15'-dioxygenase [Tautonia rosea]|uniref:Brp/Blh family beta-carotene 15,15'-dioxygenase n=1 Tax=Tautonia rosea TaxID=2728037 RepID=UPI00147443D5|nr:Brp/Blh family beta-carotene 15,15'-dioxygenase [Tautonia rosea]
MSYLSASMSLMASVPGILACTAALGLVALAPEVAEWPAVQWAPWGVGLLVFGIPHGALDHRIPTESDRSPGGLGFLAGYLGAIAVVLMLWWIAPMAALIGFLVVAAFHFGQGDLYWSRVDRFGLQVEGDDSPDHTGEWPAWRSVLLLLVRGVVPIALPVLVFDAMFAEAANALTGRLFGDSARWAIPESIRKAGLVAVGLLVAFHLATLAVEAWRRPDRRAVALSEAAGSALLVVLFSVVPPVLAMGVYFNAWHSVRHVVRLLPVAEPTRSAARAGQWLTALARFHRSTLPTTLIALAMMGGLWWFVRARTGDVADFGLAALAMVSALTLPHVIVVLGMDRMQAVWDRPRAGEVRS